MSIVARKIAGGKKTTYWIVFNWQKKRVWERSGANYREAERLLATRKAEVKAKAYVPPSERKGLTFGQWCRDWLDKRATRNELSERRAVERYVLPMEWLADMPVADLRPKHIDLMVAELRKARSEKTGALVSTKSVANIYGTVHACLRAAKRAEHMNADPCDLPKNSFRRKASPRLPYSAAEIRQLLECEAVPLVMRVWIALAFFTGMREGEVCGRRWRDLVAKAPLHGLTVDSQYDGQPLKTEDEQGERPRVVPVHPDLQAVLTAWREHGWEQVFCRKPAADDFIVPNGDERGMSRTGAYRSWRRACDLAGIANKSLHSTRHTFISIALNRGAPRHLIEKITHNAKGDIVANYTHWEWAPLCEAVLCFSVDDSVDPTRTRAFFPVAPPGVEPGKLRRILAKDTARAVTTARLLPPNTSGKNETGAERSASQQSCPDSRFAAECRLYDLDGGES